MFQTDVETLTKMGAQITTAEIKQQPELWRDALDIYKDNLEGVEKFLAEARAMAEEISRKTYPLEEWRKGRRVVIDTTHVRHVDVFAVAQQAQALVGSGIDCPNEVRALTGQPPIPEGWADSYQMTLNNQTLGGGPDGAA